MYLFRGAWEFYSAQDAECQMGFPEAQSAAQAVATIGSNFEGTRAGPSNKCLKLRVQIQINGMRSHNSFGTRQMDFNWDIQKHP